MVFLSVDDEANTLFLTEGYLPDIDAIKAAWPRKPTELRLSNLNFQNRDVAAANFLSAMGRRVLYYKRYNYGGLESAMKLPLECWIIGPSRNSSAKLKEWFSDAEDLNNYRVVIHRSPPSGENRPKDVRIFWYSIYRRFQTRPDSLFKLKHREDYLTPKFRKMRNDADCFLKELLKCYEQGQEAALEFIKASGHPYEVANYIPEKRKNFLY